MEGMDRTLRLFLDELGLFVESLGAIGSMIALGFLVAAVLVVYGLVRK